MSKDVRYCFLQAEALRHLLMDERYEPEWRHWRSRVDEFSARLEETEKDQRSDIEALLRAADPARLALLASKPTRLAFCLLVVSVRHCLLAAAVLQACNAWLVERPLEPGLILNANAVFDHVLSDRRSLWPMMNGHFGASWD